MVYYVCEQVRRNMQIIEKNFLCGCQSKIFEYSLFSQELQNSKWLGKQWFIRDSLMFLWRKKYNRYKETAVEEMVYVLSQCSLTYYLVRDAAQQFFRHLGTCRRRSTGWSWSVPRRRRTCSAWPKKAPDTGPSWVPNGRAANTTKVNWLLSEL